MTSNDPSIHDLITDYYDHKPNFADFITESSLENDVENLQIDSNKEDTLRSLLQHLGSRNILKQRRRRKHQSTTNMPVHPAEETASGSITDQVAKESKDSTASTHPLHQEDTGATSGGSVDAMQAHKANLGPVIAENIGKPAGKDELKKRAEELNKK
jgi:hypothetical protein